MESTEAWMILQRWKEALSELRPSEEQMQPDSGEESGPGGMVPFSSSKD